MQRQAAPQRRVHRLACALLHRQCRISHTPQHAASPRCAAAALTTSPPGMSRQSPFRTRSRISVSSALSLRGTSLGSTFHFTTCHRHDAERAEHRPILPALQTASGHAPAALRPPPAPESPGCSAPLQGCAPMRQLVSRQQGARREIGVVRVGGPHLTQGVLVALLPPAARPSTFDIEPPVSPTDATRATSAAPKKRLCHMAARPHISTTSTGPRAPQDDLSWCTRGLFLPEPRWALPH